MKPPEPLKTFSVFKASENGWKFWMNVRGKSAKQVLNSVWFLQKGKIPRSDLKVAAQ